MQSCAIAKIPATPFVEVTYPSNLRSDLDVPTLILLSEFGLSDDGMANCVITTGKRSHHAMQPNT